MSGYDIMIDIDDVIVPWFETVDRMCVERWGLPAAGSCRTWSMHEHYGRTREEWEAIVISATTQGLYTSTDPFPGSVEALRRLYWAGHRLHIVTARGFMANGENIRAWTRQYLADYAVPHETLTFARDKYEAMEALEVTFDFAVDDGLHNFTHLLDRGVPVYLHDAPHNRHFETDRRVASLWDFANIVLAQAGQKETP